MVKRAEAEKQTEENDHHPALPGDPERDGWLEDVRLGYSTQKWWRGPRRPDDRFEHRFEEELEKRR